MILGLVGLLTVCILSPLFYRYPHWAFGVWLGTLIAVPFWLTARVGPFELPPATLAAFVVLPAVIAPIGARWSRADTLLAATVVTMAGGVVLFDVPRYLLVALIVQGVTAYLVGRRLTARVGVDWACSAIAVATILCGLWAVLELVTRVHIYENLQGAADLTFWNKILPRGGLDRSEGAWGHPIALGAWLSLGLPFVLASRWRVLGGLVVFAGVFATLSRGPILGCLLGLLLFVVFYRKVGSGKRTALAFGTAAVGTVLLLPVLQFLGTVSTELDSTSSYRSGLLAHALADVHLLGRADFTLTDADGHLRYRGFGSIDNAFLLMAVEAGALVTLLLAAGLVVAAVRVVGRRWETTPGDIALASQIVVLATVAMITQYQAAIFFIAGVAVTMATRPAPAAEPEPLTLGVRRPVRAR